MMRTADFEFDLPPELIAQRPAAERDQSRLLVVQRGSGELEHRSFRDLGNFIQRGDVLVLNDSRVIPARLRATNVQTGGQFELLLLEEHARNDWWAMVKPGKRACVGTRLEIHNLHSKRSGIEATVTETNREGHRRLLFHGTEDVGRALDCIGEVPLPPYILRDGGISNEDSQRYQTIYAQPEGSVAAPTAGLHFTAEALSTLRARGVVTCFVTLHVGVGTFAPVKTETLAGHKMHEERYTLPGPTACAIRNAKARGTRVFAVGTTTLRVLESIAAHHAGQLVPESGRTALFVYPPYEFKIVDALLTNFHLPRSTLLMLVSAFASPGRIEGWGLVLGAYREAIRQRYRFFSYGDAMLLL